MQISIKELESRVEKGFIKKEVHPTLPLVKWHYTEDCIFSNAWDYYTKISRGLVTHENEIVGWPFEKFFNLGETEETKASSLPDLPYEVTEKIDGSMIIVHGFDGELVIDSKGMWISKHGEIGKQQLWEKADWEALHFACVDNKKTLIFELRFPGNAVIKVEEPKITLIGAKDTEVGFDYFHDNLRILSEEIKVPVVRKLPVSLEDIVNLQEVGKEGFVVRYVNGLRVKVKTPWYWIAHRLRYSWSPVRAVELLKAGFDIEGLDLADTVEEGSIMLAAIEYYKIRYNTLLESAEKAVEAVRNLETRKEQALYLMKACTSGELSVAFALLDGKDYSDIIWKRLLEEAKKAQ